LPPLASLAFGGSFKLEKRNFFLKQKRVRRNQKKFSKVFGFFKKLFTSLKSRRAVFFVFFFVFIFCLLHTNAYADPISNSNDSIFDQTSDGAGLLSGTIGNIMLGVLGIISYFLKLFIDLSAHFLDAMLKPDIYNFAQEKMVVNGWIVVRDVCNLFFLLILLFIAICTILKIEKYHAKKTLLMLIIMALLINFSKPIAIFIFDGSQLLMNFFLKADSSPSSTIANFSHISDLIYKNNPGWGEWMFSNNSVNLAVRALFNTVFLFVLFVVMIAFALFLLIRIVAIWILVILAPLAFLSAVVPGLEGFSSTWWNALFKYSYVGPVMAFFIWLSTQLFQSTFIEKIPDGSTIFTMKYFISYMVTVIFLYASLVISQKFGTAFAGAIVGNANNVLKWGAGMTKGGGMWGAGARVTGAADMYKGVKGGIAKQPGWRMLTKKGREAKSKENQQKWEEKVAPFNIANVRKKAKEMENDSQDKINAGVGRGDAASIHEASRRGALTAAQMQDPRVKELLQKNPDLQKDIFKNLADKGQAYKQAEFQATEQIGAPGTVDGAKMNAINAEIYKNTSNNKLVEQDLAGALHNERDRGGDFLNNRLTQLYANPASRAGFDQLYNKATNEHTITMLDNIKNNKPALSGIKHP
jgi:hypothetical protein